MKFLASHESSTRGTFDFPIELYYVDKMHPRYEMPFHWHKWTEINFIIRGSADGIMNNRTIKMTEGDIWVVNYEVIHSIENCSDDLLYVQMHLNIESFSRYVPDINTVYFQCYPGECEPAAEELLD